MFDLIITVLFYTASGHKSYSTTVVSNFSSEQTCRYAGAQHEVTLRQDLKMSTDKQYSFTCVRK